VRALDSVAVDEVVDAQVAEAVEAEPTVTSESSVVDQVVGTAVDSEVPQLQHMAEASVAHHLQLPMVELLHTVEDMVAVDTETHQEVAAANLGGKLSLDDALFLFGPLSTLVQFIDLGQRRQTDVGSVDTTSFLSTFIIFGAILCFRVLHSCDTFRFSGGGTSTTMLAVASCDGLLRVMSSTIEQHTIDSVAFCSGCPPRSPRYP